MKALLLALAVLLQAISGASELTAYYMGSALSFLREYGMHYRLFDRFFSEDHQIVQDLTAVHDINISNSDIKHEDLSARYLMRDYSKFQSWAATANSTQLSNTLFKYNPPSSNADLLAYNNIFRYGPGPDDRFLSVGFSQDPWTNLDGSQVYFVGVDTNLPGGAFTCQFKAGPSSPLEVTRNMYDAVGRLTKHNIAKCPIPPAVSHTLTHDQHEICLDLLHGRVVLLPNVCVPRVHSLDRRRYTLVMQTMLESLDDPMLIEWMVYNILLGVEHFYLYYNFKSSSPSLGGAALRPFLQANLITLVPFPFLSTVHFMFVQHAALNAYHFQFGPLTEWTAYWDIDEFFLPAPRLRPAVSAFVPALPIVTHALAPGNEPGIMFDTQEMGCASWVRRLGGRRKLLNSTSSAVRAVTTDCTRAGYLFNELRQSHGKMLIRPARVAYMFTPHRLNDYWVVWTNPSNEGSFRHFNGFRYTNQLIKEGGFKQTDIGQDSSLRDFTLQSLRYLLGVK